MLEQAGFSVVRFRRYGGRGVLAATEQAPGSEQKPVLRLKRRIFEARRIAYCIPALKRSIRYVYWHLLRMNAYMSVCAIAK